MIVVLLDTKHFPFMNPPMLKLPTVFYYKTKFLLNSLLLNPFVVFFCQNDFFLQHCNCDLNLLGSEILTEMCGLTRAKQSYDVSI